MSHDAVVVGAGPNGLAAAIELQRRTARLRGAIGSLPPRQRETLVLKVYKELRFTDIAHIMSCSVGTAKANFFHAMANLRRVLAEQGESNGPL